MRAIIQRVKRGAVRVDGQVVGRIDRGYVLLVGVATDDTEADARFIAEKVAHLRLFPDETGRMEVCALETGAEVLVVSQFTLHGDARKGRRPSYSAAASGELAERLYEQVCERLRGLGLAVQTGRFGAMMEVEIIGDGPVTILLDSRRLF